MPTKSNSKSKSKLKCEIISPIDTPIVNADTPIVNADTPIVNADTPIVNADTSIVNADTPIVAPVVEIIKAKRGRKSKKELMALLNIVDNDNKIELNSVVLNINETVDQPNKTVDQPNEIVIISTPDTAVEKPLPKKRGRKPKGGKIVQQVVSNTNQTDEPQNVILHLKCAMKDLQNTDIRDEGIESYNFLTSKNNLKYEILENVNTNLINDKQSILATENETDETDETDETVICKDVNKEIWKKLKQLEQNLHINNVNNKRSACFWDTCEFDNPPIYIPKHFVNGTYHVYGCFCSPECGVAYLMNENIDSSAKFERYHLFNHIYSKVYDYKKNIKPAPNPYYMLEKYYGNLSTQEYRSLLRNERLFLIVDKPLTRILPELHEDNDEFILNNKIIQTNNYNVKARIQRKKQNKSTILNEQFGGNNNN